MPVRELSFFAGFDALVLLIGTLTGFVIMAIALAPSLSQVRRFHCSELPPAAGLKAGLLGWSPPAVAAVPMLLVLAAELRIGGGVAQRLVGGSLGRDHLHTRAHHRRIDGCGRQTLIYVGRELRKSIALFLALLAVATTVSVIVTSLPIPQLANGPMVRGLVRNEVNEGLQLVNVWPLAFQLPPEGFATLTKPYTQPFGAIGPLAFIIGTFAIATGISTAPMVVAAGRRIARCL